MIAHILVPIAQGSEEMEAVIIVDILRRAGFNVKIAGESSICNCSKSIRIIPDVLIDDLDIYEKYEAIVIPGGSTGTQRLMDNAVIEDILRNHSQNNGLIGAICAAPTILSFLKIIKSGIDITAHPSVEPQLVNFNYLTDNVVVSKNLVTSRGAGTAIEFALKIVEILKDKETSDKISNDIVFQPKSDK